MQLRDTVYEAIKRDIITGALQPGERLHEVQLAERFATSKTPVREALNRLVQDDLLAVFARVGYAVTPCTVEDAHAVFDFRAILEGAAVELAARYITDAELTQLATMAELDFEPRNTASYDLFFERNRQFHVVIAGASRNPHVTDAVVRVFDKVNRLLHYRLDLDASSVEHMRQEHRAIVGALERRDPETARQVMVSALIHSKEEVVKAMMAADVSATARRRAAGSKRPQAQAGRPSSPASGLAQPSSRPLPRRAARAVTQ
jgi:DNA-binding GntR family transcriptional regulator